MWLLIALILCAAGSVYVFLRLRKKTRVPHDTYVCDVCGETECLCRKEN